jgi:hypothetical protein
MTSLDDPSSGLPRDIQTQGPEARAVQLVSANAHPKREQLEKGGWTFKQSERGWLAVNRLLDRALTRPTIDMLIETIVSGDVVR